MRRSSVSRNMCLTDYQDAERRGAAGSGLWALGRPCATLHFALCTLHSRGARCAPCVCSVNRTPDVEPIPPPRSTASSTSTTCGAWPGGACPAPSSTTSTAAPTARSPCSENRRSWNDVLFRPRNAVRVPSCDTTTRCSARRCRCRCSWLRSATADLPSPTARWASPARPRPPGIGYVLSTFAGYAVEQVAAAAGPALVSAVPRRRTQPWSEAAARARLVLRLPRAGCHHRHQRARHAGARPPQPQRPADWQGPRQQAALRPAPAAPPAVAGRLHRRPQGRHVLSERRDPRQRADAGARRARQPDHVDVSRGKT